MEQQENGIYGYLNNAYYLINVMLMSLKLNEYLFICLFACLQLVASSCSSNKHELLDDSSDYIFSFSKSDILDAQNFVDTYIDYIDQDWQLVSTSVNDRSSYI